MWNNKLFIKDFFQQFCYGWTLIYKDADKAIRFCKSKIAWAKAILI